MYQDEYKRWAAADLLDFDLNKELNDIAGDDEAIKDRFAVALEFGTAGLRGVLGAGTNRMNIWVVRQATQGVADWVKTQGGTQTVAKPPASSQRTASMCASTKSSCRCRP